MPPPTAAPWSPRAYVDGRLVPWRWRAEFVLGTETAHSPTNEGWRRSHEFLEIWGKFGSLRIAWADVLFVGQEVVRGLEHFGVVSRLGNFLLVRKTGGGEYRRWPPSSDRPNASRVVYVGRNGLYGHGRSREEALSNHLRVDYAGAHCVPLPPRDLWRLLLGGSEKLIFSASEALRNAASQCIADGESRLADASGSLLNAAHRRIAEGESRLADASKALRKFWDAFPQRVANVTLRQFPLSTLIHASKLRLDKADRDLIDCWEERQTNESDTERALRLEAARLAEKAALAYYGEVDPSAVAKDASIGQLSDGSDWMLADIWLRFADGRTEVVDVKNVRVNASRSTFSEVYWERAKPNNRGGQVPIAGVATRLTRHETPEQFVLLGELSSDDIKQFGEKVHAMNKDDEESIGVAFHAADWSRLKPRVPYWMLEYRPAHYRQSTEWGQVAECWLNLGAESPLVPPPPFVAGLWAAWGKERLHRHPHLMSPILKRMRWHFSRLGQSRRSVFWFVLAYLLENAGRAVDAAGELSRHLFINGNKCLPIGLHDPLSYIDHFIEALSSALAGNPDIAASKSFRLVGAGVLKARDGHRRETTVLAYCGNCQTSPIFLSDDSEVFGKSVAGRCQLCSCYKRRLVCDRCGSCDVWYCPKNEPGRAAFGKR